MAEELELPKEFYRFLRQTTACFKFGHLVLPSGSVTELPLQYVMTNLTDYDEMFVPGDYIAVTSQDPLPSKNFRGTVWTIDVRDVPPGYAKLRLTKPCTTGFHNDVNRYGHTYLENERVFSNQFTITGPAITSPIISLKQVLKIYGEIKHGFEELGMDVINSVPCKSWPLEATEWVNRRRESGWPTPRTIERVVEGGCHLVPKPHPSNPLDRTVFRFSFSMAEKLLIRSMTPKQKYIYHILRLIKSKAKLLNTYFFKTLMMWECEEKPPRSWDDTSIEDTISELLCRMVAWLIEGYIPNYFIPANNMIGHLQNTGVGLSNEILKFLAFAESDISLLTAGVPMVKHGQRITLRLSRKLLVLTLSQKLIKSKVTKSLELKISEILWSEFSDLYSTLQVCRHLATLQTKPQYGTLKVIEGFEKATSNRPKDNQFMEVYFSLSDTFEENLDAIFEERNYKSTSGQTTRNREVPREVEAALNVVQDVLIDVLDKLLPRISYFVAQCTYANFLYVFMRDYDAALRICEKAQHNYSRMQATMAVADGYNDGCSVVLSSEWMALFDRHIQTVFGYLLLQMKLGPNKNTGETRNLSNFFLPVSPIWFAEYITTQCKIVKRELTTGEHTYLKIPGNEGRVQHATELLLKTIRSLSTKNMRPCDET